MISKALLKKGYRRTQQECRHKWVNCLSPQINHDPWTDEELRILYTQYNKNLSRWSVIQRLLPNRTQIKIKNHFYGVLRNMVRFVLKHFRKISGRQTQASNKINPNTLKSIYWGEGGTTLITVEFQFLKDEAQNVIQLMKYRFNKQKLLKIVSDNERLYSQLNQKLLQESKQFLKIPQLGQNEKKQTQNLDLKFKNTIPTVENIQNDARIVHHAQAFGQNNQMNCQYELLPYSNQMATYCNMYNNSSLYSVYFYYPLQNIAFQNPHNPQ